MYRHDLKLVHTSFTTLLTDWFARKNSRRHGDIYNAYYYWHDSGSFNYWQDKSPPIWRCIFIAQYKHRVLFTEYDIHRVIFTMDDRKTTRKTTCFFQDASTRWRREKYSQHCHDFYSSTGRYCCYLMLNDKSILFNSVYSNSQFTSNMQDK